MRKVAGNGLGDIVGPLTGSGTYDYGDPRGDSNDPAKYSPLRAP